MSIENGEIQYGSIEGRTFISRAVLRRVEPGTMASCNTCDQSLKFAAVKKLVMVIANVYNDDGKWERLESYHVDCYQEIGAPYGSPAQGVPVMTLEERQPTSTNGYH